MTPKANQIYKHFKGNLYRIITLAKDAITEEEIVVYQALYGDYAAYTRPLGNFMEVLDRQQYPAATQIHRFERVEGMIEPVMTAVNSELFSTSKITLEQTEIEANGQVEPKMNQLEETGMKDFVVHEKSEQENHKDDSKQKAEEEEVVLDPMLEAYLDTDSCREKLNILHALRHRITDHMLLTMAVVIDFELPEGSIEEKYEALNNCLMTRERYECNRMN